MDENVNRMKLTNLLSYFFSYTVGPLLYNYLYFKKLIVFLDVHTREKQYLSLMYSMYANTSSSTPSYTYISAYAMKSSPTRKFSTIEDLAIVQTPGSE